MLQIFNSDCYYNMLFNSITLHIFINCMLLNAYNRKNMYTSYNTTFMYQNMQSQLCGLLKYNLYLQLKKNHVIQP